MLLAYTMTGQEMALVAVSVLALIGVLFILVLLLKKLFAKRKEWIDAGQFFASIQFPHCANIMNLLGIGDPVGASVEAGRMVKMVDDPLQRKALLLGPFRGLLDHFLADADELPKIVATVQAAAAKASTPVVNATVAAVAAAKPT
jgi:hypothetical protein